MSPVVSFVIAVVVGTALFAGLPLVSWGLAVILLQMLTPGIIIVAPFSDRHQIGVLNAANTIRFVGVALFAAGFNAMNWSAALLGKQFSVQVTLQADHQLITGGPYQYIRHPRYLSIIIYNLGGCAGLRFLVDTALCRGDSFPTCTEPD